MCVSVCMFYEFRKGEREREREREGERERKREREYCESVFGVCESEFVCLFV